MSRENLYVALTRGRVTNTVFVPVDQPDRNQNHEHAIGANIDQDLPELDAARAVLAGILHRVGAEPSAHQARVDEENLWRSIAQLAAEYDTIAAHGQRPRWTRLVLHTLAGEGFNAPDIAEVLESAAFGPLCFELRRAEADGHDVSRLLPRLAAARSLHDADDIAAVLHHRVEQAASHTGRHHRPRFIAGLVPHATGPMSSDARRALDERALLIEQRANALAESAVRSGEAWTRRLAPWPTDPGGHQWARALVVIAAYRDRHHVSSTDPVGPEPTTLTQRNDRRRALAALRQARLAQSSDQRLQPTSSPDREYRRRNPEGLSL